MREALIMYPFVRVHWFRDKNILNNIGNFILRAVVARMGYYFKCHFKRGEDDAGIPLEFARQVMTRTRRQNNIQTVADASFDYGTGNNIVLECQDQLEGKHIIGSKDADINGLQESDFKEYLRYLSTATTV